VTAELLVKACSSERVYPEGWNSPEMNSVTSNNVSLTFRTVVHLIEPSLALVTSLWITWLPALTNRLVLRDVVIYGHMTALTGNTALVTEAGNQTVHNCYRPTCFNSNLLWCQSHNSCAALKNCSFGRVIHTKLNSCFCRSLNAVSTNGRTLLANEKLAGYQYRRRPIYKLAAKRK